MSWYQNPILLSPLFGFLGVIVGGAITTAASFLIERRREIREREREEKEEQRSKQVVEKGFRTAARLVEEELTRAKAACSSVSEDKTWWRIPAIVTSSAWEENRATLAAELSAENWSTVKIAMFAVARLAQLRADAAETGRAPDQGESEFAANTIHPKIAKGRDLLASLSFRSDELLPNVERHIL